MASLIVIALVLTVTGVLAGGFIASSVAISRGHHVRSVIWKACGVNLVMAVLWKKPSRPDGDHPPRPPWPGRRG
jgi:hypothetical protein